MFNLNLQKSLCGHDYLQIHVLIIVDNFFQSCTSSSYLSIFRNVGLSLVQSITSSCLHLGSDDHQLRSFKNILVINRIKLYARTTMVCNVLQCCIHQPLFLLCSSDWITCFTHAHATHTHMSCPGPALLCCC